MRVGDIVRPLHEFTITPTCVVADTFGPAIVKEFSNVNGYVYVTRPFESHMVYVFRVEDLEVVHARRTD